MSLDPVKLERAIERVAAIAAEIEGAIGECAVTPDGEVNGFDNLRGALETVLVAIRTGSDVDLDEAASYPFPDW